MQSRLTRSTTDRKIAGVAGGIAHYYGIDVSLVRVLFVLIALPGGISGLVYFVLWAILPEGPTTSTHRSNAVTVAEERYARGEITAEELRQIRRDLQGD